MRWYHRVGLAGVKLKATILYNASRQLRYDRRQQYHASLFPTQTVSPPRGEFFVHHSPPDVSSPVHKKQRSAISSPRTNKFSIGTSVAKGISPSRSDISLYRRSPCRICTNDNQTKLCDILILQDIVPCYLRYSLRLVHVPRLGQCQLSPHPFTVVL